MAAPTNAPDPPSPVFSAVITPNLALGRTGTRVVLGVFLLFSAIPALVFLSKGAWPILPFLGLEIGLVWLAFRVYRTKARAYEEVSLTPSELLVRRVSPDDAVQEHRFNPYWVRLSRHTLEDEGLVRLAVTSHGRSLVIAHALSPPERERFARALDEALVRVQRGPAP
jgi:uncharacterized membrane protein